MVLTGNRKYRIPIRHLFGSRSSSIRPRHRQREQRGPKKSRLYTDAILQLTFDFVALGGTIQQMKEQRPECSEFEYYYKLIVPVPDFAHGLFVEMRLVDADLDCPTVHLVNAHRQRK